MKPQPIYPTQDPDQEDQRNWQELAANDPYWAEWNRERDAEDQVAFEEWLETPAGYAWINGEADMQAEKDGRSWWNHDGFNPEPRYA